MYFYKGKNITLIGFGKSNRSLLPILEGANITIRDKNLGLKEELNKLGLTFVLGENYLENLSGDLIFRTPGLRPDNPQLIKAKENGSIITSEINEFFKHCPCKTFGITGSDGKTTTTTLISKMLEKAGFSVHTGGNIGVPLLARLDEIKPKDVAVVELSSFQLMDLQYKPNVVVITNITPNHLDWHKDMQEYAEAKQNIIDPENNLVVLNKNLTFSGNIVQFGKWQGKMALRGEHHRENIAAAALAVKDFVSNEIITEVAESFTGVSHRDEFVRELNGVKFYNDSIGSSPTRTIATLSAHSENIRLILGGRDKKVTFDTLAQTLKPKVQKVYLLGEATEQINLAVGRYDVPVKICKTLKDAVISAFNDAEKGESVLLSPACTSFDMYNNFEERGKDFVEIVNSLEV